MTRAELVGALGYKPGWTLKLAGPNQRFLCVFAHCPDSVRPGQWRTTQHQFEIPDEACADRVAFARWALEALMRAERHEACEFFQIDGQRPFFPAHGDGDPYEHREVWT
jgi:hypothetical protein